MNRSGLTLIEVMAVVLLLGLLAAATAWSLADDARRCSQSNVAASIAYADHTARLAAKRFALPFVLRFDLSEGRIVRLANAGVAGVAGVGAGGAGVAGVAGVGGGVENSHSLKLPGDCRIGGFVVSLPDSSLHGQWPMTEDKRYSGQVDIAYSPQGRSASYALKLSFDTDNVSDNISDNEKSCWLFFSGLTGQMTLIDNEEQIDKLFSMLQCRTDLD